MAVYHHFGNDLIDSLIGYGTVTEEQLTTVVKSGNYDLNKLDASNRTPLYHLIHDCAVDYKPLTEVVKNASKSLSTTGKAKVLFALGANPNVQDSHGWTVLHQCAAVGNLPMLQLFVQHGGNVCIRNVDGKLPVDLAVIKKHQPIVEYLEKQSGDLKSFCRLAIRDAMGKRTYNRINELPLPPTLKLFVNYYNPYPGFTATLVVPCPWSDEDILRGDVGHKEVKEFLEENASEDFKSEKNTVGIGSNSSVEDLAAMMEALYFWESFKAIEFADQPARPPRYSMTKHTDNEEWSDEDFKSHNRHCYSN